MTVPADVRNIIGQSVFRVSTGEGDKHKAGVKSLTIIAGLKRRIEQARATLQTSERTEAAALAERFRQLRGTDADKFVLEDVLEFALKQGGHALADYGRRLVAVSGMVDDALDEASLNRLEIITGEATPFLKYTDQWIPHAGLKPRPLDQAVSSVKSFSRAVAQPLEKLEAKHVQAWIDGMINPDRRVGIKAVTVARKMGEVRNYWKYLQSVEIIPEGRDPFANRRIKDPANRKQGRDEKRQKWTPAEVRRLWEQVASSDPQLHNAVKIAAYSGARIEGVAQIKVSDIRLDRDTGTRFMHMADKSAAGDRDVPIHPEINSLIDAMIANADPNGYLIHSDAKNKYGERSQPIGKRFGKLKTALGYDGRYVFHSIRKTVASLMQDAGVAEGVAADLVRHVKPGMTYGLYGGMTEMSLRARELTRSVRYPIDEKGESSPAETT